MNHHPLWLGYTDMEAFTRSPVTLVRGYDCTVEDSEGYAYTDFSAGTRNVLLGYSQQHIVEAMADQLAKLPFANGAAFGNDPALRLADRLANMTPVSMPRILFHSSGSEAVEAAIKLVRQQAFLTGSRGTQIATFNQGYHGQTLASLSASGESFSREPFQPLLSGFVPIDVPSEVSDIGIVRDMLSANDEIGAVMVEPLLGNGGVIGLPRGYLQELRSVCDESGALLICDEITTGLGRCGYWFLSEECAPDILLLGKALTNGYAPLSAVVVAEKVWQLFDGDDFFRHGQTNLNHPVCCAAGLATLDLFESLRVPHLCAEKGERLSALLSTLCSSGSVRAIRGKGLLLAVDIEEGCHLDRGGGKWLERRLRQEGFVAGQIESTLLLSPPAIIGESELQGIVRALDGALRA